MALTITIPGAVEATIGATAPAILTVGVGVPGATGATGATGAQGPQGDPGEGVPVGGSAGQVLAKIDGTNYNTEWVNVEGDYLPLAGGAMDANASITIADTSTGTDSEVAGWGLGVQQSDDHTKGTTVEFDGLNVYDGASQMQVTPTGITFPDATTQTTAATTPDLSGYLTKSGNLSGLANVTTARTNLSLGSTSNVSFRSVNMSTGAANPSETYTYFNTTAVNNAPALSLFNASYDDSGSGTFVTSSESFTLNKAGLSFLNFPTYDGYNPSSPLSGGELNYTASTGVLSIRNFDVGTSTDNTINISPTAITIAGQMSVTSTGITFPDATVQTTAAVTPDLSAYAPLASPAFTGNPTAPTATFGDDDTSIATTAFVQAGLLGGTANARNLEVYVRNQSGASIPAGSIVYISGATGNRPLITLSQANNDANSAQTMGFTKTVIANNAFGYVIVRGEVENLNTSALTEGDQLYLSPTVAGAYTTTKPVAPQHLVYVGIVIRAHPTLGAILVAVQNGYELGEIHDVLLTAPANNDLLAYESSTDLWKNKSASTLGLAPLADAALTGNVTITSNSATAALTITQDGAGDILRLNDVAGDTTYSFIDQNGKINTIASTTANAGLNIPHGNPPTTPVNGDIWTTTANLVVRLNGANQSIPTLGLANTFSGVNTFSANVSFSAANSSFGTATGAATYNFATGSTVNGATKTVNIGINGVAGSTTNIAIGSTTGTSTTTLQGITNGVTQAVTDYSTKLATTAFVTNADMSPSVLPLYISGMTAVNTSGSSTAIANGSNFGSGSSTAGYCLRNAQIPSRGGNTSGGINWTRPVALSARLGAYFQFQTQCVFRMNIGGSTADLATPTTRSIGVSFGASAANTLSALVLEVHNGTSLASVTTSFTPTFTQQFDLVVYSDGAGNVTCYVNGTQVGTSAAGPTTAAAANQNILQLGLLNTSVPTLGSSLAVYNLKYLVN
jgi:hypothetical protein